LTRLAGSEVIPYHKSQAQGRRSHQYADTFCPSHEGDMNCLACGTPLSRDAKACPTCGRPVGAPTHPASVGGVLRGAIRESKRLAHQAVEEAKPFAREAAKVTRQAVGEAVQVAKKAAREIERKSTESSP
jgi:predicted amidophosphoribosyltransferase